MILAKLGWRDSRRRPGRAILTLASVVIGVAAVVAVTFTTQSTRRAFDEMFAAIAGRADLEVAAPIGETIDASLLPRIRDVPGVAVASPMVQRPTIMYAGGRRTQVSLMGVVPELDRAIHDFQVESGKPLAETGGLLLSADFAQSLGLKLGDEVHLLTRSGRVPARITGLYKSRGTAVVSQGATLVTRLADAQRWVRAPRRLDAIQIVLAADADEQAVQAAIARELPEHAVVRRPAGRSAV
ncbi:MAG: ABC transporter permease, partial [Pirellulales bacterium]|nr:ABC transporter permease [Pirellulales bacterium]